MKSRRHGIIIKVNNLDLCRTFYRDVLQLGPPVMDSNFWVEFRINDTFSLILEQIENGEKHSAKNNKVSWMLQAENMEKLTEKLKEEGCKPQKDERERVGYNVVKYCDPEGNPFYICS